MSILSPEAPTSLLSVLSTPCATLIAQGDNMMYIYRTLFDLPSSCMVKQDLSAYWTPPLYFQWANGSFTLVNQVGGAVLC